MSVARAGEQDRATARRVRLRGRRGVTSLRVPPATAGPYVVTASAFARRGSRSTVVSAALR